MRFFSIALICSACSVTSSANSTQAVENTAETDSQIRHRQELEPANLDKAHFYLNDPGRTKERHPLALEEFNVSITTAPGTLRTRIDVVVRNSSKAQRQANIRVPIPSNAAVTEAVLYVGDKPMRGAFLEAKRAEQVYKSYTQVRRDPLLAVWSGPDWVDLQIFPVEGEKTRRFQLEWVEPRVTGSERHRLPELANAGQVVGTPRAVLVDGQIMSSKEGEVSLPMPSSRLISVRQPGAAFGYVLASGERPSDSAVVLVAETSAHMTLQDRAQQRHDIETVLWRLPAATRVTLLSADWLTKNIAVDKSPEQVIAALADLDEIISAGSLDMKNVFSDASALAKKTSAHSIVFFGEGRSGFGGDAIEPSTQSLRQEAVSLFVISPRQASRAIMSVATQTDGRGLSVDDPLLVPLLRSHGEPPEVPGVEGWTVLDSVNRQPMWMGRFLGKRPGGATIGSARDVAAIWARSQVYARGPKSAARETNTVLTPATSILVLERDAEYRRWGIPVPAAVESKELPVLQFAQGRSRKPTNIDMSGGAAPQGRLAAELSTPREAELEAVGQRGSLGPSSSTGIFSNGIDDRDVYGGLFGNEVGEMQGGWGFGQAGGGTSGSGTGWGTIGTGQYGTIGHGTGTGTGYGMRGRKARPPLVRIGSASVSGGLDKKVIHRYIRRKMPRIRHCFEKELLVRPSLGGTIVASFQIAPSGKVQGAVAKGIRNGQVQSCVAAAIQSIQFPNPKSGGYANVRYSFMFSNGTVTSPVVTPLGLALAAYDKLERPQRALGLSKILGVDFKTEAMLAWWIYKERLHTAWSQGAAVILAAKLLHDAGDNWNARRVLSQIASSASEDVVTLQREMGFAADAERMVALQP